MSARVNFPPVIFGSTALGNIYEEIPYATKLAIVRECVNNAPGGTVMFDSAGKYGAGLALEVLGQCLEELGVPPENVIISNKLAWYRIPLSGPEPTFEPGVWHNLKHDAVQKISYQGILDCYEQGNELLGKYKTQTASVHDPDEYLAAATDKADDHRRYQDILDAYKALQELKAAGKISSVGVGAKNWKSIQRIAQDVELDWVMIANSITVHSHPKPLLEFMAQLHSKGVAIINSAVFNGGFLVGRDFYNYKKVDPETEDGKAKYAWRAKFFELCAKHNVTPAEACFNFGFRIPGVNSVALSTSHPEKVKPNIAMATCEVPVALWDDMKANALLEEDYLINNL